MCDCRLKLVRDTENSRPLPGILFRVSSSTFDKFTPFLFSDVFLKGAVIPINCPRSELGMTLVAICPGDAFIDLIAISILGAKNTSDSGQTFVQNSVFNCFNNITHCLVNLFIKTCFQGFHSHRLLISH